MSESKVPLPRPTDFQKFVTDLNVAGLDSYTEQQMRAYGDARAAEARRLALLEALQIAEKYESAAAVASRLRALADEASPKQVSG